MGASTSKTNKRMSGTKSKVIIIDIELHISNKTKPWPASDQILNAIMLNLFKCIEINSEMNNHS